MGILSKNCSAQVNCTHIKNFYLGEMKVFNLIKPFLLCVVIAALTLVGISLLDIIISVMYSRFYSTAAFVVTFGVCGVFATVISYFSGIEAAVQKNEFTRWSLLIFIILIGFLFFFLISKLEGGEYAAPFKAYGIMMALTTLLFMKGKIE